MSLVNKVARSIAFDVMRTVLPKVYNQAIDAVYTHVTISEDNSQVLYEDACALAMSLAVRRPSNIRMNKWAKAAKDVFVAGDTDTSFTIEFNGVKAKVALQRVSTNSSVYSEIVFRVYRKDMDALTEFLSQLVSDKYELPYYYNVNPSDFGRGLISVGRLPALFATQEQFVSPEIYDMVDERINRIVNNPDYYVKNQITKKEVILLYGPPGTGKTSLGQHFSGKYGLDMVLSDPSDLGRKTRNLDLHRVRMTMIDDIDSYDYLCKDKDGSSENDKSGNSRESSRSIKTVSNYTDFINYLDGPIPLNNEVVIITSNRPELLRESIVRSGRVDLKIYVPEMSNDDIIGRIGGQFTEHLKGYPKGTLKIAMIRPIQAATSIKEIDAIVAADKKHWLDEMKQGE